MRRTGHTQLVIAAFLLAVFMVVIPAWASSETCIDKAKSQAAQNGLPILIKVGTGWSEASAEFDKVVDSDDDLRSALDENVILCTVDAKKGKGVEVAAMYSVRNFPTFILVNSQGETIDRWYGFGCHDCFVKRLVNAVEDPLPINQRIERFQNNPTEKDAHKIGEIRHAEGMFAEAAAYYARAQELNPDSETNYDTLIFNSMAYGNYYQLFSTEQVKNQADIVLASNKRSDKDLIKVALSMFKVANRTNDVSLFLPYLKTGIEETANSTDEGVLEKRATLMPEYTLYIKKDTDKAIALKKKSMPEGWLENAKQLNTFAWWCFLNKVNLPEAQTMAKRGIELAPPGREKANILDTLAELCNLSGDCGEAIDYIQMAVIEDPENEYFQEQLVRFEKLLAAER